MIIFSSSKYFEQIYKSLTKAGLKIDLLVTECPKPAGRRLRLTKNPAHLFAESISLPILAPKKLEVEIFSKYKILNTEFSSDLGLVFSYGRIIPDKIIEKFRHGILNIHPSLLPKYRGPTPLQTALLNGDQKTGFSIIKIRAKCDAGDIIFQREVKIALEDNFDRLMKKVMGQAIAVLPEVCQKYLSGKSQPAKQKESEVTYTKKFNKSDGFISKNDNAETAFAKIRAFSAWPKAYLIIDDKKIIIHDGKIEDGKLKIGEIQMAGKNKTAYSEFKNGYADLLTKMPDFVKV